MAIMTKKALAVKTKLRNNTTKRMRTAREATNDVLNVEYITSAD
jgi:hypothetical protein